MLTQSTLINLRVTVEGTPYRVQVEVLPSNGYASAASRVEGAAVGPALPRPKLNNLPRGGSRSAPPPQASALPAKPVQPASPTPVLDEPRPDPLPPRAPWHNLTLGKPGECLAPVPGIIRAVLVKVGDKVRPGDPLIELQIAARISPQDAPSIGTIRAVAPGAITDLHVQKGDAISVNQLLITFKPA
jgi:biotin carboxyl carrier protein